MDPEIQKRDSLPRGRFDWRIGAWRAVGPVPDGWPRFVAVKNFEPPKNEKRLVLLTEAQLAASVGGTLDQLRRADARPQ